MLHRIVVPQGRDQWRSRKSDENMGQLFRCLPCPTVYSTAEARIQPKHAGCMFGKVFEGFCYQYFEALVCIAVCFEGTSAPR